MDNSIGDKIKKLVKEAIENHRDEKSLFVDETSDDSNDCLAENAFYEAEMSEDERRRRYEEAIAYMNSAEGQMFYKFLRRDEANVFNALFYDKEDITEEDAFKRVKNASDFFQISIPCLIDKCETLASITYSDDSEFGREIRYDIAKLREIGINNVDAFDAMLTHELSHVVVSCRSFNFLINDNWGKELACDYIVGARCRACCISTGKYKYAVSMSRASITHPDGEFRVEAVMSGFEFADRLITSDTPVTLDLIMSSLNLFLCKNSNVINTSYNRYLESLMT